MTSSTVDIAESGVRSEVMQHRLKKRYRRERRFRFYCRLAISFALFVLMWLLLSLTRTGFTAFGQHFMILNVTFSTSDEMEMPPTSYIARSSYNISYRSIVQQAVFDMFPDVTSLSDKQALYALVSASGSSRFLRKKLHENPQLIDQTISIAVPTSDQVDQLLKGYIRRDIPEDLRKISDQQMVWVDELKRRRIIRKQFNYLFFTQPDSRDAELAGIASAVTGSLMIVFIAFLLSMPIGIGAALYLDEFAPKNRLTDFVEININNLAAVPSIVFGLLGLTVFINFFSLPRSVALVGGLVLALRAFPTIVVATRAALQAVSPGIMSGALSVGASHVQAVFHQKLPLAAPGILTGSIIAMAQVLGETAPLLMIGMVAFVTEIPTSVTDPATALPIQIFLWSDSAERAWEERTAAAILVLLVVLVLINSFAIWLRNRLEKRT